MKARLLLLALLAAPASAQEAEIRSQKLAEGLFFLEGRGGNVALCGGRDGTFLVDDQFGQMPQKILATAAQLASADIRFVINTHYHRDHTGGNPTMVEAGAVIVAHENVRRRLSAEEWVAELDRQANALPVVTFASGVTFHLNGREIRAVHVGPAHTDGDTIVHFVDDDVIHMGDTYFNGLYPFVELDAGGKVDGVIEVAELVLGMSGEGTRIIPGHGPLSNREELRVYRDMLITIRDNVAALVGKGLTLEEIVAAKPGADFDEEWGGAFIKPERMVETVYRSLTGTE